MESYERRLNMGNQAFVDVLKYKKEFISKQWSELLRG